jgi:hypothetical protein
MSFIQIVVAPGLVVGIIPRERFAFVSSEEAAALR